MTIFIHDTIRKENSVVTPVSVVADESFIKPTLMLSDASGRKTTVTYPCRIIDETRNLSGEEKIKNILDQLYNEGHVKITGEVRDYEYA